MDRRVKKTKKAIFAAYLQVKNEHPDLKPSVKEICAFADINKTTFYRYFADVDELTYTLLDIAIHRLLIDGIEIEFLLTKPEIYFHHVLANLEKFDQTVTSSLYHSHIFAYEAERIIKGKLKETYPDKYDDALCTFIAGGVIHWFLSQKEHDEEELQKICCMIKAATQAGQNH